MKKIISLVLALTLLVGVFGVATVAFAEEPAVAVTPNQSEIDEKVKTDDSLKVLVGKTISEGDIVVPDWLGDKTTVESLFNNINFETEEKGGKTSVTDGSDKVLIQYFKPSGDRGAVEESSSKAYYAKAGNKINVAEVGWWSFRFVVVRPRLDTPAEGEEKAKYHDIDYTKDIVASSALVSVWAQDTDNPIISTKDSDIEKLIANGLTVGTRKSVSTNIFNTTDNGKNGSSSYITVNYIVEKIVDGKWVKIYDTTAETKTVKGYEDCISSSGILASKDEISKNKTDYKYRVTYTFVDAYGHVGKDKEGNDFSYTLNLVVNEKAADNNTETKVNVWKIVLYVVAGLSAVGIVVLLCVKPKQSETNVINGKVHYGADVADSNAQQSDDTSDNE